MKEFPGSLYAATGEDQVSLIMGVPRKDRDSLQTLAEESVERIRGELPGNTAERIFVYGGNVVEELEDVLSDNREDNQTIYVSVDADYNSFVAMPLEQTKARYVRVCFPGKSAAVARVTVNA